MFVNLWQFLLTMPANVDGSFDISPSGPSQHASESKPSAQKLSSEEARRIRLDLHKRQCQNLIGYFKTKKCRSGLDNN